MKKLLSIFLTAFVIQTAASQATSEVIRKIEGFKHPESVASDTRHFYVSNLGNVLDPNAKDGDGFISKLNKFGEIMEMNAFPDIKLNSPKGMTILNDVLYVTDVDSIIGIDVRTKKVVWGRMFFGTKYLNDILARDENTLYVSATDVNQIYEIDLLSDSVRVIGGSSTPRAPNGLGADLVSSFLFIVSFGEDKESGEIGRLNLRTNEYETVFNEMGKFDGVFYSNGRYYISDWGLNGKGRLFVYDIRRDGLREIKPDTGYFQGPADFFYDFATRRIWLPCMLENAVYILKAR